MRSPADSSSNEPENEHTLSDLVETAPPAPKADNEVARLVSDLEEAGPDRAQQALFMAGMHFSGPLPPADELKRYNEVGNGLGTRIGEDFFTQRKHDRDADREQLMLAHRDADRADREQKARISYLIYTYFLITLLIAGAVYLFDRGKLVPAAALISPAIIAVFGVVIRQIFQSGENGKAK